MDRSLSDLLNSMPEYDDTYNEHYEIFEEPETGRRCSQFLRLLNDCRSVSEVSATIREHESVCPVCRADLQRAGRESRGLDKAA